MQPIGMPAWRLTAESIWNSFRISGKKHLFLTGTRGSGKSSLLRKLAQLPGITTWALPGQGVYLRENGTEQTVQIGRFDPSLTGRENRMQSVYAGFLELGIPALQRCINAESPWVTVDEIGFLETGCEAYCEMLCRLLESKQVLACVRKQALPFLTALLAREDAFVIDLDQPFGSTGCVIMASGLGRRFGGNKLMADFRGQPMLAHILSATACIPHRVVVTRHASVADYCREREIPCVLHALPYRSDTVRLGLEALPETDRCLFCPADQPLLREETVWTLALSGLNLPEAIVRPCADGEPGAPILFPRSCYPELCNLPQGKGGGAVAKKHPEQIRLVPVRDRRELMDIDTPEDRASLLEQ